MNSGIIGNSLLPTAVLRLRNFAKKTMCNDDNKVLYLTFDDGPDRKYTPVLLNLLEQHNVKVTFFVVAEFARDNRGIIKRMSAEGHKIALHSLSHKCPAFQNRRGTEADVRQSLKIMKEQGVEIKFYRPPWGVVNLTVLREMKRVKAKMVLWDTMAGDWEAGATPARIKKRLTRRVRNGAVICLHDGRGKNNAPARTIKALEEMLPYWKALGYSFHTIGD